MSSDYLLEVRDMSVNYGPARALDHVTYLVRPGRMVCLLGGNACGKSTSMKGIFGTVPLASGDIYWEGERITHWPTQRRVAAGLAIVPEGRRMFARLSVEENLHVGAIRRRDRAAVRRDLDEMYQMFPRLAERRTQPAGTLSGGEQQMVAIARALMSRPKLVCMDEPSMGLASALVRQSFALIERIRERGTSVFVVEQNANAALRIADYAYVLRSGQVVLQGPASQVAQSREMKEAYLGPTQHEPTRARGTP